MPPARLPAFALAAALLALAGCETAPDVPASRRRATADKDHVLLDYRTAATAMRTDKFDDARVRLDDAILTIGGILANSADAVRARSLFSSEREKTFIGEPYERVMAYYYRGILYWQDGQPDNARACFRSGQLIDGDTENARYRSDYVLLDYLDGLASVKLAADGADALARAQANAAPRHLALPPYDPEANVFVFAEFGRGPRKLAGGNNGERLLYDVEDSPTASARLTFPDGAAVPLPAYDDLNFQAITRGGRVMDGILANKADFKRGADTFGNAALVGAAIAHNNARSRGRQGRDGDSSELTALGLGLIGLIGKAAASATETHADTRQWDNLPQRLSFAALRLAPGDHPAFLQFCDREGNVLEARTRRVTLTVAPAPRDTVVFFSELKR